jgi:hypothetical protein
MHQSANTKPVAPKSIVIGLWAGTVLGLTLNTSGIPSIYSTAAGGMSDSRNPPSVSRTPNSRHSVASLSFTATGPHVKARTYPFQLRRFISS